MQINGVIFDLDGTLIDSMGIWYKIDRLFLKENGVTDPPADISDRMKKMTVDESSEYFISHFGLSCTKEYVIRRIEELVRHEYEENIQLKPCVEELLDLLDSKCIPYGIATATYRSLAEAVLRRCGIYERFSFLLTDKEFLTIPKLLHLYSPISCSPKRVRISHPYNVKISCNLWASLALSSIFMPIIAVIHIV